MFGNTPQDPQDAQGASVPGTYSHSPRREVRPDLRVSAMLCRVWGQRGVLPRGNTASNGALAHDIPVTTAPTYFYSNLSISVRSSRDCWNVPTSACRAGAIVAPMQDARRRAHVRIQTGSDERASRA